MCEKRELIIGFISWKNIFVQNPDAKIQDLKNRNPKNKVSNDRNSWNVL